MHADYLYLWPLVVLFFYSTLVDSVRTDPTGIPQTYWIDTTCLRKGFSKKSVEESLSVAVSGALRLMNQEDGNQAFVFQKLFGRQRDTRVFNGVSNSPTWRVVGMCDLRHDLRCCTLY